MTYTPGPWHFVYGAVYTTPDGREDGGARIALADREEPRTSPAERDANARLTAAAPELLEALRDVLGWYETQAVAYALAAEGAMSSYHKTLRHAHAAIAKATR